MRGSFVFYWSLLILLGLGMFSDLQAQKSNSGEISFQWNEQKYQLAITSVEVQKSNLIKVRLRGEKKGDTLCMLNFGMVLKSWTIGKQSLADTIPDISLMVELPDKKSFQFSTATGAAKNMWIRKSPQENSNLPLETGVTDLNIKNVEFKSGNLWVSGTFQGTYLNPSDTKNPQPVKIKNGQFSFRL
jgi:hypothetical protein